MDLNDSENSLKERGQVKSYRNVARSAFILGLPSDLFFLFLGVGAVLLLIMLIAKSWIMYIVGIVIISASYGMLYFLVERHGVYFFKKLMSYYTDQTFSLVRRTKQIKKYYKK